MAHRLEVERIVLRGWDEGDALAALGVYGDERVARWLAPAIERVEDAEVMRTMLERWIDDDSLLLTPAGRWAIEHRENGQLVGGASLLPLPPDEEFEIGWALHPEAWGRGYATESGLALARWAFDQGIEQVIALVRPANTRAAAMVRRIGMEWVGETDKYYGLTLQIYRLTAPDLDYPEPTAGVHRY